MNRFSDEVVGDYMTRRVKTVTRHVTLRRLLEMFDVDDFDGYPVQDEELIIGMVTKLDCLNSFILRPGVIVPRISDVMNKTAGDIMAPAFLYVVPSTKLARVVELMVEHRTRSMPVIDTNQHLVGIVAREDVIRTLSQCETMTN